jgi:hypothetical protein
LTAAVFCLTSLPPRIFGKMGVCIWAFKLFKGCKKFMQVYHKSSPYSSSAWWGGGGESCPMVCFGISRHETLASVTSESVHNIKFILVILLWIYKF